MIIGTLSKSRFKFGFFKFCVSVRPAGGRARTARQLGLGILRLGVGRQPAPMLLPRPGLCWAQLLPTCRESDSGPLGLLPVVYILS
jgi:hypothetical protein